MNPLPNKQPFWAGFRLTPPPTYVITTIDGYSGPMVLITLFGEDSYAAPLGDSPPNGGIAWVLHTRERKWERLSADAFIARIVAAGDPPPFDPMARD